MDFIGKICPYCKTAFTEDDEVVVCSICEMPHHKECWIENKACTTFGCTGTIVGADQYSNAISNKSFCPKCGTPLSEGSKFCGSCGTPADATGEPHFRVAAETYPTNQNYQQNTYAANQNYQQNAYAANQNYQQNAYTANQNYQQNAYTANQQYSAPQYNSGYNTSGQQQVDPNLYPFIQKNQQFYMQIFQKMQMNNSKASWNWCSFLFGAYWFAYRKMYGIAAAYVAISLVSPFISSISGLLLLALPICSGIFGNYFYKRYIDNELQMARNMDAFNKNAYIAKKGGTSTGAVWVFIVIMFFLGIIAGLI